MVWRSYSTEELEEIVNEFFSSDEVVSWYEERNIDEGEEKILEKYLSGKGKVLDLMCGTGRIAVHLAKLGFEVVGVDISREMITTAKKRMKEEGVEIKFVVEDAEKVTLPEEYFDYVLILENSLEHIPSKKKRVRILEVARNSLKKEGILITSFHSYFFPPKIFSRLLLKRIRGEQSDLVFKVKGRKLFFHFFTPFEIRKDLKSVGFRIIDIEPRRAALSNKFTSILISLFPYFFYSFYVAKRL